jgi:glyoxylase-like metal-dependent hydrolase (beta-lactamase superfamily II)
MWSKWIAPDQQHRIPLACRALLASPLNGKTVLFEAGIGAFFDPKLRERYGVVEDGHVLLESLANAGFSHQDIDAVVLSHLHFDHAGGVLTPWREGEELALLFPKAFYFVGEDAWERASHPHPRDRASFIPELTRLLESSGRLKLVHGDRHAYFGETVRFHHSQGHTPGLLMAEICGADDHGGVVFCTDLVPGRPWVHLPVTMGYDRYPELLIEEKRDFLEDKLAREVRLFFTHDVDCALARVTRDGKGRFGTDHEVAELRARTLA